MTQRIAFVLVLALVAGPLGAAQPGIAREVNFQGVQGTKLVGTLQLPPGVGARKIPGVVLLAGSGPTDRNGNQPPVLMTDLLKQVAQKLADQGVATLRFDKRGMHANAGELPKDKAKFGEFFTWENFAGDAVSGVRFLREQPEIDPERVGMLGHSEGGLLALEAARTLKLERKPPAVLILASTPGRSIDVVITEQLKGLLGRQGATALQSDFFLRENARILKAISQTGEVPPDVPAGLAGLYPAYLGRFLRSEMALDPAKAVAEFSGPVLIIAGTKDSQVSPDRDAKALEAALAARANGVHKLLIIPDASHNLKIPSPSDEHGFTGPVVPAAIEQLQQWVHAYLQN